MFFSHSRCDAEIARLWKLVEDQRAQIADLEKVVATMRDPGALGRFAQAQLVVQAPKPQDQPIRPAKQHSPAVWRRGHRVDRPSVSQSMTPDPRDQDSAGSAPSVEEKFILRSET